MEYLKKNSQKSPHIELQIYIKANFKLRSWIAAGAGGVFQSNPKEIHFENAETLQWDKGHLGFVEIR